jgi:hypothetical protein
VIKNCISQDGPADITTGSPKLKAFSGALPTTRFERVTRYIDGAKTPRFDIEKSGTQQSVNPSLELHTGCNE